LEIQFRRSWILCRTFGARFMDQSLPRPYGRGYFLSPLRGSTSDEPWILISPHTLQITSPGAKRRQSSSPGRKAGDWSLYICVGGIRPKGPAVDRPGRQAGISVRMKSSAEGATLNQKHISGHIRFRGGRAGPGVLPENRIDYGAHPDCEYS